jgi:NADPH:quinone reductase-like Zn-dependent oxidoreductase
MITEVELPGVVEPDGLLLRTRETPRPGPGQALVRMEATGVSFAEQQMRRGTYWQQPPFPFVPGYDVVGTVVETGPDTPRPETGARVAALTMTGGWADHLLLDAGDLVPVPDGVGAAEAEAVIVNGLTAHRMLEIAAIGAGDTIVVLGANGGVGSLLVQLARLRGAEVIGTCSARHLAFVRDLGATPIDRSGDLLEAVHTLAPGGVKAVFDHVGGRGIVASWRMLAAGGVLVSYGTAAARDTGGLRTMLPLFLRLRLWQLLPNGRSTHMFAVWDGQKEQPSRFRAELHRDLTAIFGLLVSGAISARIARSFRLSHVVEAVTFAESGVAAGKVVLVADQD